jgi:hypothetical protein
MLWVWGVDYEGGGKNKLREMEMDCLRQMDKTWNDEVRRMGVEETK